MGDRDLRLYDLQPHEHIVIRCCCGYCAGFPHGFLQRRHKVPSDTLIYDLQFRLRCKKCGKKDELAIVIQDQRFMGSSSDLPPEKVIVPRPAIPLRVVK